MFRSTKTTAKGSVTKIYIETKKATAGMVVAHDGKPLTPEERKAELARIQRFLKNPEELEKKHRQEQQDAERTLRIVKALPDAFLYEYAGQETGSATRGKTGDPLVVLKFRPNPKYEPPSRVELVLTGMEGVVMLDARCHRLALIDGKLFKEVGFGWGILGHLDKGGHFLVQQQAINDKDWTISSMKLDITGKVLFVKSIVFSMTETFSDFKPVPKDITFAQAVDLLEKEETVFAENFSSSAVSDVRCPLSLPPPQRFFPYRNFLDHILAHAITGARCVAHSNHPLLADFYLRFDDVFFPIPLRGRNVSRATGSFRASTAQYCVLARRRIPTCLRTRPGHCAAARRSCTFFASENPPTRPL